MAMSKGTLVFVVLCLAMAGANADVPAVFVFGDSTADVGTNNFLPRSKARADFPPNGIDFPHSIPTGRFSNGLNSADFLAVLMGFEKSPPPFFSVVNSSLFSSNQSLNGVNFASGGSGLLRKTGSQSIARSMKLGKEKSSRPRAPISQEKVIALGEQIQQFAVVRDNLMFTMGPDAAKAFLSKSLFFISTGSNDLFGYYHSRSSVPVNQYISLLVSNYHTHLKNLVNLGARKFGIVSVAPIGCCPSQRAFNASGGCLDDLNEYATTFHTALDGMLQKLSSECKDMKYSLGNAYEMTINVINNPQPFNFTEVKYACCGSGSFNGQGFCNGNATLCSDRKGHLFWDLFHPTEAASQLAAATLYGGNQIFVSPINFSQLAAL